MPVSDSKLLVFNRMLSPEAVSTSERRERMAATSLLTRQVHISAPTSLLTRQVHISARHPQAPNPSPASFVKPRNKLNSVWKHSDTCMRGSGDQLPSQQPQLVKTVGKTLSSLETVLRANSPARKQTNSLRTRFVTSAPAGRSLLSSGWWLFEEGAAESTGPPRPPPEGQGVFPWGTGYQPNEE